MSDQETDLQKAAREAFETEKLSPNPTQWHYALKGTRIGPITLEELEGLIAAGTIEKDTPVWSGQGDWQPAKLSKTLSHLFAPEINPLEPPPLAGQYVDSRFVWLIVLVPIVASVTERLVGQTLIILYVVLNILTCSLDEKRLKAAGHPAPSVWWSLLVPGYLWKRAALLKVRQIHFAAWIATFVLSIVIGMSGNKSNIEEAACPVVTKIIKEQLSGSAACRTVKITDDMGNKLYRAKAVLDNGRDLEITIEQNGDQIYVKIPPQ